MSDRDHGLFLIDVYIAISKIEIISSQFTDSDELINDFVYWDSVIREFEVMGEAIKILIENEVVDKKFRIVVDFRNKLIHHYFGIDKDAVWSIIKNNLPDFKSYIIDLINQLHKETFQLLLNSAIEDNRRYPDIIVRLKELDS